MALPNGVAIMLKGMGVNVDELVSTAQNVGASVQAMAKAIERIEEASGTLQLAIGRVESITARLESRANEAAANLRLIELKLVSLAQEAERRALQQALPFPEVALPGAPLPLDHERLRGIPQAALALALNNVRLVSYGEQRADRAELNGHDLDFGL